MTDTIITINKATRLTKVKEKGKEKEMLQENSFIDDVCWPCDIIIQYDREVRILLFIVTISFAVCLVVGSIFMANGDKNISFPLVIYGSLGMLLVVSFYIFKVCTSFLCDF
jgi:hypothetical protein